MKNYYKIGIDTPMDYTSTMGEDVNMGYAMLYRGLSRGEKHRDLYRSGITGMDLEPWVGEQPLDVVGKTEIWAHPMDSFTSFLVDVAHLMLMLGGLYLIAGSIWGGPRRP